jgi:hypothetical protein
VTTIKLWATNNTTANPTNIPATAFKEYMPNGKYFERATAVIAINNLYSFNGTIDLRINGELQFQNGRYGSGAHSDFTLGTVYANITTASTGSYSWKHFFNVTAHGSSYQFTQFAPEWNVSEACVVTSLNVTLTPNGAAYFQGGTQAPTALQTIDNSSIGVNQMSANNYPQSPAKDFLFGWLYDYKSISSSFTLPLNTISFYLNWSSKLISNATYNSVTESALTSGSFTGSLSVLTVIFNSDFLNTNVINYSISYYLNVVIAYLITFAQSGLYAKSYWYVNSSTFQSSGAMTGTQSSYSLYLQNGSYSFTIQYGIGTSVATSYIESSYSSPITINGAVARVSVTFTPEYSATFSESGIYLSYDSWFVNSSSFASGKITTSSFSAAFPNGTYDIAYGLGSGTPVVAYEISLPSYILSGPQSTIDVTFTPEYSVTVSETGLYIGKGTTWSVSSTSFNSGQIGMPSKVFYLINGSYTIGYAKSSPDPTAVYAISPATILVSSFTTSFSVTFAPEYGIAVTESGLYLKYTSWSISSSPYTSGVIDTSTFTADLINGTYSYVYSLDGISSGDPSSMYLISPPYFSVSGGTLSPTVTFVPEYSVSFTESGLSSGTTWSVTLNFIQEFSDTTSISFNEDNGTYPYSVGTVTGYTASAPGAFTAYITVTNDSTNTNFTASLSSGYQTNIFVTVRFNDSSPVQLYAILQNGSFPSSSWSNLNNLYLNATSGGTSYPQVSMNSVHPTSYLTSTPVPFASGEGNGITFSLSVNLKNSPSFLDYLLLVSSSPSLEGVIVPFALQLYLT